MFPGVIPGREPSCTVGAANGGFSRSLRPKSTFFTTVILKSCAHLAGGFPEPQPGSEGHDDQGALPREIPGSFRSKAHFAVEIDVTHCIDDANALRAGGTAGVLD